MKPTARRIATSIMRRLRGARIGTTRGVGRQRRCGRPPVGRARGRYPRATRRPWPTRSFAPCAVATRTAPVCSAGSLPRSAPPAPTSATSARSGSGPEHIVRDLDVIVEDAAALAQTVAVLQRARGRRPDRRHRRRPRVPHRRQARGARHAPGAQHPRPAARLHAGRRRGGADASSPTPTSPTSTRSAARPSPSSPTAPACSASATSARWRRCR